ncbi:MAG: hypothetical protein R6U98_00260 [Pirellulaceae bacterium]
MENCPTQAVLPLVGLAADVAVHGYRYTAWTRKARMDATGLSRGGSRSPLQTDTPRHAVGR